MADRPFLSVLERHRGWLASWEDFRVEDLGVMTAAFRQGVLKQAVPAVVPQFEERFAQFAGAKFGVSFCNGTSALYTALRAVGIGPGDEVLIADYGFHGMAAAILAAGATVVPCDIDFESLCLDPAEIEAARGPATKAVLVHNPWGLPANWRQLQPAAGRAGLALIADASHAHGALCAGEPLGAFADITCYSLGLRKLISGGELGCAVTSSAELRDRMLLHSHVNRVPKELAVLAWNGNAVGLKARPHPLAVALALAQRPNSTLLLGCYTGSPAGPERAVIFAHSVSVGFANSTPLALRSHSKLKTFEQNCSTKAPSQKDVNKVRASSRF